MAEGKYFPSDTKFAEIPSFKALEDITGTEFSEAGEFTGTKTKKGMQIVIDREQGRCYYAPEDYGPEHLRYGIAKAQGAFTPEEWWGMEHDPDFGRHSAPWELAKRAFWGFAKLTDIGLRFGNDGTDAGLKLGPVTLFDGNGAGGQLYGAALAALREAKAPETAPELEGFYRRVSEWAKRKDEARRQALQLFDDSMMIHGLPGYIGEVIGSTAGSLLTAAAVGSVGGLPAVAAVFGSMQFHDLRAEYLEKKNPDGTPKYTIEEANRYAFEGGLKEGLVEMMGFKYFRRWATLNNSFRNWVLASIPEGLQEALQSIAEAELTTATGLRNEAIYGDDEKAKAEAWKSILLDIAISAAAGGITGFGGAMLTKSTEIRRDKFEYELEKQRKEQPKLEYKDSSAREIPNPNVVNSGDAGKTGGTEKPSQKIPNPYPIKPEKAEQAAQNSEAQPETEEKAAGEVSAENVSEENKTAAEKETDKKKSALPFAAAISGEDRAAWERAEQNKGSDPLHDMAKAIAADYKFHDEDGIIAAYAVARRLAENGHAADLVFEGLNRQLIAFKNQLESGEAKAATEKAAEQIKYYLSPESVKDFKGNLKKQLKDGGFAEHEAERGAEGISRIYAYLSNAFGMDIAELRPLNLKAGQDIGDFRGEISLDDKIAEIALGKNSDLSSVYHEFMHYFTDVIDRAAAAGNAKAAELKKEIDRIASEYNKKHTNISGQTSDEQKLRMEAVAEAFEMWLYEDRKAGQDTEADRLFKEIQDFFRKIYDCLKSISGVRLDPETDAFFRKITGLDDIALTEYMREAEQQGTRLYQSGKKRIDYSKDGKYYENFLETHKNLITEKPPKWEDITEQALKDEIKFNEEKGYAEVQSPIDIVRFSDDSFYHLFVQNNKGRKELARRALLAIKEPNLIIECIEPNKKGCLTKFHYYIKLLKGKNESGEEEITVHMQLVKVLSGETWYVTNYPIYPNKFANKMKNGEVIYDLSAHPTTLLPLQAAQDGVYPNNRPSIATNYSITENSEKNNPNNGQTFFQSGKEDSNKFILPEALSRANERVEPVVIERHFADRKESKEIELDEVISILDKKLNVKKGDIRKINNDNGETVILSKNSIDEMFNHTSIRDGLNIGGILGKEAIANLPEIFKTAVPIAITDDLKRESSTKFIRYGNVFESDGEIFLIKITVKEFANNRKLLTDVEIEHNKGRDLAAYDIKVARRDTIQGKIKEAAAGNISTDKSLALRNGSDYIISDLIDFIKLDLEKYLSSVQSAKLQQAKKRRTRDRTLIANDMKAQKEGSKAADKPDHAQLMKEFELVRRNGRPEAEEETLLSRTAADIGNAAADAILSVRQRAGAISRRFKYMFDRLDFTENEFSRAFGEKAFPFVKKYRELKDNDRAGLDFLLLNGMHGEAAKFCESLGMGEEYKNLRHTLDEIHALGTDSGIDMGFIEDYFPTKVRDYEGLITYLKGTDKWTFIELALERLDPKGTMTPEERAEAVNKMLRGYDPLDPRKKPDNAKERKIFHKHPNLMKFYEPSDIALLRYMGGMAHAIAINKAFHVSDVFRASETVGAIADEAIKAGLITRKEEGLFKKLLKDRITYANTPRFISMFKNFGYLGTMNNFTSAITQLGDLYAPLYMFGTDKAIKGIFGKKEVTVRDLGLETVWEELRSPGADGIAVKKVFDIVGLSKLDRFGKENMINAALADLREKAASPDMEFMADLADAFGGRAGEVLADIRAGKTTFDVKMLLWNRLADTQPIGISGMPSWYLKNGATRLFYQLKTYTLTQLSLYWADGVLRMRRGLAAGNKKLFMQGAGNFCRLLLLLTAFNAGADLIKNLLMGRKVSVSDTFVSNLIWNIGVSKYAFYRGQREGYARVLIENYLLPPQVSMADDAINDTVKVVRGKADIEDTGLITYMPYGRAYYWWFGGGRDAEHEKDKKAGREGRPWVGW